MQVQGNHFGKCGQILFTTGISFYFYGKSGSKNSNEEKSKPIILFGHQRFGENYERLQPEVLTELLTEYLTAMTRITKFDMVEQLNKSSVIFMVFFGDPHSLGVQQDAINCVKMALDMKKLTHFRQK